MEPTPQPPTNVVETGEASEPAAVREVFRAKHRLAVSVMERPQQYTVAYSLADIHRLTFLSHEERTAVQNEWNTWHRKYVRLSVLGLLVRFGFAVRGGAMGLARRLKLLVFLVLQFHFRAESFVLRLHFHGDPIVLAM